MEQDRISAKLEGSIKEDDTTEVWKHIRNRKVVVNPFLCLTGWVEKGINNGNNAEIVAGFLGFEKRWNDKTWSRGKLDNPDGGRHNSTGTEYSRR